VYYLFTDGVAPFLIFFVSKNYYNKKQRRIQIKNRHIDAIFNNLRQPFAESLLISSRLFSFSIYVAFNQLLIITPQAPHINFFFF